MRGGGAAYNDARIERDNGYGSDAEVDSRNELSWRKPASSPSPFRPQYKRSHISMEQGAEDDAGSSGVPSPSDVNTVKRQNLQPSPPRGGPGQIAPASEIAGTSLPKNKVVPCHSVPCATSMV